MSAPVLHVRRADWEQMQADVSRRAPEEACGVLAGMGTRTRQIYALENALHSPTRYRLAPREQLHALNEIDRLGLELVAIYHSHPHGPDIPSPTDIAEAAYPESVYLIWSHQSGNWRCRGFFIHNNTNIDEVSIQIVEE